jgi:hypothetical protein
MQQLMRVPTIDDYRHEPVRVIDRLAFSVPIIDDNRHEPVRVIDRMAFSVPIRLSF